MKSKFFEKINMTNKASGKLTKQEREKFQINKISNERSHYSSCHGNSKLIRPYLERYSNELDKCKEVVKFLNENEFPKVNQDEIKV